MTKLHFEFKLDRQLGVQEPVVRIWIDANRNSKLDDDEELGVQRKPDTLVFTSEKDVPDDNVKGMPFRVKYFASPGSKWSLTVKAGEKEAYKAEAPVIHAVSGVVGNLEPMT